MVRFPATCTPYHTAHALTVAPQYQLNSVAAGANGTKTAKAQPKDWNSPLVCSRSLYCARTPHTWGSGAKMLGAGHVQSTRIR
jgi:hypothetical protein